MRTSGKTTSSCFLIASTPSPVAGGEALPGLYCYSNAAKNCSYILASASLISSPTLAAVRYTFPWNLPLLAYAQNAVFAPTYFISSNKPPLAE